MRPHIPTSANLLTHIQLSQLVPVISGATTNNLGGITPVIGTPQQVGIILQVTPRISPDGTIVMETIANKSAISGRGVPILTDPTTGSVVESPIFDLSEARATVAVPDGQTIVLGGMITQSDDTIERKVPWLGDIPFLGTAFRYDGHNTRRTELLIFMTPRIIHGTTDSEIIKQIEIERTHFFIEEAEAIHGPLYAVPEGGMEVDSLPSGSGPATGPLADPTQLDLYDSNDVPTTVVPLTPHLFQQGATEPRTESGLGQVAGEFETITGETQPKTKSAADPSQAKQKRLRLFGKRNSEGK